MIDQPNLPGLFQNLTTMFPAERRRQIVQVVNEQGSLSIPQLSRLFSVSEMTIHRDLDALADMGLLHKTRGGALASEKQIVPLDYQQRLNSYPVEKDTLGRCAAQFIHDGETILLEAGTTSLSVARYCRGFDNLTVYTNGPMIALELAQVPGVEVYSTGGLLSKRTMAYVGPEAERVISQIRPDKCFLGANGFTLQEGVTDPLPLEASVKRKMVKYPRRSTWS
ncbi:MAG: DeoR/GlpR family DNA-binding transcription regulator [Omnitrophica WOR_2 bacterium]